MNKDHIKKIIHPVIDSQMEKVKNKYTGANIIAGKYGEYLVCIPRIKLLSGWKSYIIDKPATYYEVESKHLTNNSNECTILFKLPIGFPGACPRYFWTKETLRDNDGFTRPQYSSEVNPILGFKVKSGTWFQWSLQMWNPNSDSIFTYLMVCKQRLQVSF